MPEQNTNNHKERQLAGEISASPSADEIIEGIVEALRDEIEGTTGEVVAGDPFEPKMIGSGSMIIEESKTGDVDSITIDARITSATESRSGSIIHLRRETSRQQRRELAEKAA